MSQSDVHISYLPLAHMFERIVQVLYSLILISMHIPIVLQCCQVNSLCFIRFLALLVILLPDRE